MSYVSLKIPKDAVKPLKEAFDKETNLLRKKLEFYEGELKRFEDKHKMASEDFQRKFDKGELGDDAEWFDWLFALKITSHLRERLSALEGVKLG
jgi:hypothetical protein